MAGEQQLAAVQGDALCSPFGCINYSDLSLRFHLLLIPRIFRGNRQIETIISPILEALIFYMDIGHGIDTCSIFDFRSNSRDCLRTC